MVKTLLFLASAAIAIATIRAFVNFADDVRAHNSADAYATLRDATNR